MFKICESCNGSGYLVQPWDADDGEGILCPSCNGDGVEEDEESMSAKTAKSGSNGIAGQD